MTSPISPAPAAPSARSEHQPHLCPWWVGYLLASPARRLFEKPEKLVGPHVASGNTVLELGPGMGFFTLPLARAVGPSGRVIAVDIQEPMIRRLARRVERAQLQDRVELRLCTAESLGVDDLTDQVDLAVLVYVLHEIARQASCLAQIASALRPGGRVLLLEPRGHCTQELWERELRLAADAGLHPDSAPGHESRRRRAALLRLG